VLVEGAKYPKGEKFRLHMINAITGQSYKTKNLHVKHPTFLSLPEHWHVMAQVLIESFFSFLLNSAFPTKQSALFTTKLWETPALFRYSS
jgi:hypothetical protein